MVQAPVRTLRSEIEHQMKLHNYTLSKLSQESGIMNGHLSLILNANPHRPMTIKQLDALAKAFNQPPGWLYDMYPDECFRNEKVSRPRIVPYLVRCVEVGCSDCIDAVVSRMLDDLKSSLPILFSVAEQLFHSGAKRESIPFYQYVIDNEKNNFADLFVMSQYRVFVASQGINAEENWKAIIRFESYRKRLPENIQLDALLKLANLCFTLQKWGDMERFSDELRELATILYKEELRKSINNMSYKIINTTHHLVVYYGNGFLLKAVALENQGHYKEAKSYTLGYVDLGWFELMDERGQIAVQKFKLWAAANLYNLDLLIGKIDILPEYLQFLEKNPQELLPSLLKIIKSANLHRFQIEDIIHRYSKEIIQFENYQDVISKGLHVRFRFELGSYFFQKMRFIEGLDNIMLCLALCQGINSDKLFIKCVKVYEEYKSYATEEQKQTYKKIIEEA
ncbi:helix-turn-helix domain-containing protein [Paenibacillus sp. 481]|uniref:helix-turn-helix domain-containing protein n=1 Tax=Paenibacillus sp. 481 TaxID=2835869 RepID=UPI002FC2ED74